MPAAIGVGMLAVLQLVNIAFFGTLHGRDALLAIGGTALPSAGWCFSFWMIHRGRLRSAAILALLAAILPRALYLAASWANGVWTTWAVPSLLTLGWGIFLMTLLRGNSRLLAALALPLVILTALQALGDLFTILTSFNELVTGSLALFWRYNPARTVWRQLATPAILLFYLVSQTRFLLAVRDE